jgi:hypothetical protein
MHLFGKLISVRKTNSRKTITDVGRDLSQKAEIAIRDQVAMERRPFTQDENDEEIKTTSTILLKQIHSYRRQISATADSYLVELELIAQVLAYTKLAYKRFGDYIPMCVEHTLLVPLDKILDLQFQKRIFEGEGADERCIKLAEDDPETVDKRQELLGKLEVLRRAELEVSKFQV